jgi:hypothetical protein
MSALDHRIDQFFDVEPMGARLIVGFGYVPMMAVLLTALFTIHPPYGFFGEAHRSHGNRHKV